MPELPEVETVRRGLAPVMEGARIEAVLLNRADLRFPLPAGFANALAERQIVALGRRAKYLLIDLDDGNVVICHLGMSGSFRIVEGQGPDETPGDFHHRRGKDARHDHVVFRLRHHGAAADVIYNDPRRFGFMHLWARNALDSYPGFAGLGPEPHGNGFSAEWLAQSFKGRSRPLKSALLDQSVVAGLGNIYVCEALWRSGLSPLRAAGSLVAADGSPGAALARLAEAIRIVIADAIAAGGSSLRDHIQTDGTLGYFQHSFCVYDRAGEPCLRPGCGGVVTRIVQAGRSSFYCAGCQE